MAEVQSLETLKALQKVTDQLKAAMQSRDAELAKSLAEKWDITAGKCDPDSELFRDTADEAEPAFLWLDRLGEQEEEEKQYAAEVKKLQKVLRSATSTMTEIYRVYDAVADIDGFDIPQSVQEKYEQRIAEFERQQKKKKTMTIVGVALGVIVLLAVAYSLIF